MTEEINKSCQSVYFHLHNIRQIRKFLTPQPPPNCLYKAWSWHALIIATVFSMAYQLCIFPNCNVFRSELRSATYHPYTQILSYYPGAACTALVTVNLLWNRCDLFNFKAIHNLGPAYLNNLIHIKRWSLYNPRSNMTTIWALFSKTQPLSSNALLETDHLLLLQPAGSKDIERFTALY